MKSRLPVPLFLLSLVLLLLLLLLLLPLLGGCAHYPINPALPQSRSDYGYRFSRYFPPDTEDQDFFILTFSGGGTRAAALAHGILQELERTEIAPGRTLLDEVDLISAVSGGSFTAMYFGLHGKEGFSSFEQHFLRKDIEGLLTSALKSPRNLMRLASPRFSRVDLAAELYDREIFRGKTFGDLLALGRPPFIIVNASEIDLASRFEFTQEQFDRICSDLQPIPVARAVAASSAVPFLLTPVRLRSYAGRCGYVAPPWITLESTNYVKHPMVYREAWEQRAVLDPQRVALHLMDGAISGNLGVLTLVKALSSSHAEFNLIDPIRANRVRRVAILVVNAGHESAMRVGSGDHDTGISMVMRKAAADPVTRSSFGTLKLLSETIEDIQDAFVHQGRVAPEFYVMHVSLYGIRDANEHAFFDAIGTNFSLSNEQIDRLIAIGPKLLRESEDYQRFLRDLRATH